MTNILKFLKKLLALVLAGVVVITAILTPMTATAASASDIFSKTLSGTTTIDKGGAMHSQSRSIYSLGGGMISYNAKKISLFSLDAPSISAGCSGINWHFGGFDFISMAEIQQMVEAISQSALGLVIDLAINVICPQCYAVLGTMREMANKMRGQNFDSCSAAKNLTGHLGKLLPDSLKQGTKAKTCAEYNKSTNKTPSLLGAEIDKTVCGAAGFIQDGYNKVADFVMGIGSDTDVAGAAEVWEASGNITYDTVTAMGFPDGLSKDIILSVLGMHIYPAKPEENCNTTLGDIASVIGVDLTTAINQAGYAAAADSQAGKVAKLLAGATNPNQSGALITAPAVAATQSAATAKPAEKKKTSPCLAPILIPDLAEIGKILMCGFNPEADYKLYQSRLKNFNIGHAGSRASSLLAMCGIEETSAPSGATTPAAPQVVFKRVAEDPYIYTCKEQAVAPPDTTGSAPKPKAKKSCMVPSIGLLSERMKGTPNPSLPQYTGLAWFVMDSLMEGVRDIRDKKPNVTVDRQSPPAWYGLIARSDYPLYRVLNFAAVYPGVASDIIDAYGTTIAAQHVMQTLDLLVRVGNQISVRLEGNPVSATQITQVKADIAGMVRDAGPFRDQALRRLKEKQLLVEFIVQMNKSLQAEVMSKGLMGNADLAVSLKANATSQVKKDGSSSVNTAGTK